MKKVLFISHYPGIGGANLSMLHLISNLRKNHSVEPYVLLPSKGPFEKLLLDNEIPYRVVRYMSWRTVNRGALGNCLRKILMLLLNHVLAIRLNAWVKSNFDILYQNSSKVILGSFIKKRSNLPIVWHLREFGATDYDMQYLLSPKSVDSYMSNADALVAISKEIQSYYTNNVCYKGKYHLIYNGIEENDYPDMTKRFAEEPLRICVVGGINPSKNQEDLIKAIGLIKGKCNVTLDLIGNCETEYGRNLKLLTEELNISDIVSFRGQVSKVNEILPNYHIGVITSKYEAFGRVVVEYMLSKLAVISSKAGACPELVTHNKTGFLYDLGNYEQLSIIINHLYNNRELLTSVANAGDNYAHNHFTARQNAKNINDLLNSL